MKLSSNENLNNVLLELRKKRKLTQQELAEKLHVSRQTIVLLEQNKYCPSLVLAFRISQFFEVEIEDVFFYTHADCLPL